MAKWQIVFILTLIAASVVLFKSSIILCINRTIRNKYMPEKLNRTGVSAALLFSVSLIVSIWLIRFSVGFYSFAVTENNQEQLSLFEEMFNSLFLALRTFSLEEEYKDYIIALKALISGILPNGHWSFGIIQTVTVIYASLLNLIAPVVGGAIVLEILASIFPKIRLRWSFFKFGRPKHFFSELNAASLSLAKSIYFTEKDKKPVLIFTDTYVDDEKEKEYELLLEAKKYGAICVRDDLVHIAKPGRGKRKYYLMDENEFGNLRTLMGMVEDHNIKYVKDSEIYLFVQSDAYVQVEKQVNKEFENERKKKLLNGGEKPTIVPILGYRNLVHNLFDDVPLYEPLIHKKDNTKLNVTILGNGNIGTQAFLGAYWFGQMLISREGKDGRKEMSECELTINVVSKDDEEVFWSKIDYINSEIKETVNVFKKSGDCNENNGEKNKLLAYDKDGHTNNPYCNVRYIKADVRVGGFWDSNSGDTKELLDSDYFVVALGNDADNISVADKIYRLVGKKHLEYTSDVLADNVIIAYAVFDSEIANALNKQKHYQCRINGKNDIFMYAFGCLDQEYSCENVYMSKNKLLAEGTGTAYDKSQMHKKHIDDNKTRNNNEDKNYTYWADLARAMHFKYKAFSLGLIDKSIFDYNSEELSDSYKSYVEGRCNLYKQIVLAKSEKELCGEVREAYDDIQLKKHMLAWLEHRRWNAFTRTMGYQYTGDFRKNFQLNGKNHKNMELKLHPCLVEAEKPVLNEKNEYLQTTMKDIFMELKVDFDIDALDKEKMISLLNTKKEFLQNKKKGLGKINKEEFDFLDDLSYEWCKEATEASLTMIEKGLEHLQKSVTHVDKEIKDIFEKSWNGVFCYDFKKYDYYEYDYKEE